MGVQQLEDTWALRAGAREARLVAASHVPAALSLLGIVRPGDRLVPLRTTLPMRLLVALMAAMLCWWGSHRLQRFLLRPRDLMLRLMLRDRTCGGL